MNLSLDGRVALVTGASKGIGLFAARALAAEGCGVGSAPGVRRTSPEPRRSSARRAGG